MATVAQTIYDALIQAGATPIQAAGIMGNMVQESSLDPEDNAPGNWGLVQWTIPGAGSGIDRNQYITGNVDADIVNQVLLLKSQGGFAAASGNTAEEAAINFQNSYERPAVSTENQQRRTSSAAEIAQVAQSNSWATYQVGSGAVSPSPGGVTAVVPGATGTPPNVPGMSDMPALLQYIQTNDPTYMWLTTIPEVSQLFLSGISSGEDIQQVMGQIQNTPWWKSTTNAYRAFLSNYNSSPADYNFNTQGSTAASMQAQVESVAGTNGVTLNKVQAQTIAIDALKYGWNSQQIQAAIGSQVYVQGAQGAQTDAGAVVQALQSQAGQYLMDPNDPVLNSWAQNIAGGTQTMAQFDAYLKQWASSKWSGMAGQIRNGNTPQQIVSPLQSSIANTLEISPAQVDFINNPQFGKILDYVPPNSTTGVHQIMTNSQAQQYVKQDAALGYGNTQGARDNAAQLEQAIVQNFGKVGS